MMKGKTPIYVQACTHKHAGATRWTELHPEGEPLPAISSVHPMYLTTSVLWMSWTGSTNLMPRNSGQGLCQNVRHICLHARMQVQKVLWQRLLCVGMARAQAPSSGSGKVHLHHPPPFHARYLSAGCIGPNTSKAFQAQCGRLEFASDHEIAHQTKERHGSAPNLSTCAISYCLEAAIPIEFSSIFKELGICHPGLPYAACCCENLYKMTLECTSESKVQAIALSACLKQLPEKGDVPSGRGLHALTVVGVLPTSFLHPRLGPLRPVPVKGDVPSSRGLHSLTAVAPHPSALPTKLFLFGGAPQRGPM
eukprot:356598-Pelagomonas_calceolata.AAC.6